MVPNPKTSKMKATPTPSAAQRGVAKKGLKKTARAGTKSSGNTDGGGLKDRISYLPNDMLCCILTLLNVHDAARTTLLSREWRHLFSLPECQSDTIDDGCLWPRSHRLGKVCRRIWRMRSDAISSSLAKISGRIRRFIVQQTLPSQYDITYWLYTMSKRGIIHELILKVPCRQLYLPYYIFNCSSLWSLSLSNWLWSRIDSSNGDIPSDYSPGWRLPLLTELTLSHMGMTTGDVEDLLQRCPALLSLSICYPQRGGRLDIRCKNLLSLTLEHDYLFKYDSVHIMDAPKLERILWWSKTQGFNTMLYGKVPKLHTLGIFQICILRAAMEQLRTIALITHVDNPDEVQRVIALLHKLPQLETLHMEMKREFGYPKSKPISFEELAGGPIMCLEKSLKTIIVRVHNLTRQKLAFANFFLGAAKVLKSMVICNKRTGGELLPQESRASPNSQVVFLENSKCTLELNTAASNYKLTDPFMP